MKKTVIIGGGFAGLSAACFMAKLGWQVSVLEKHGTAGGRARQLTAAGFHFDMGPSWYWMPGVFDRFFECFGKKVADYYQLQRLDPSYRVYWPESVMDVPADYTALKALFEKKEPGAGSALDRFLQEAEFKYQVGINKLVHQPGLSLREFVDPDLLKGLFRLDVFVSMERHIERFFRDPALRELLGFPVLFLGALPSRIPALYSLMNYADIKLGTWYPKGGMFTVVEGLTSLAKELGVQFYFGEDAREIKVVNGMATQVITASNSFPADTVISAADYQFTESSLLQPPYRSYSESYWNSRVMAPGCLLYYVGLSKRLPGLVHHNLFFDRSLAVHGGEIYTRPAWPSDPLFYVCAPSVTDDSVAPAGCENLFFLVPVASGLEGDDETLRDRYFSQVLARFEERVGCSVRDAIVYKTSYSTSNFKADYNAFRGNAYGLANTLLQTALLKPSIKSKKVNNLYYTGQLTVPGPGVPPSLISGEVVAKQVVKEFGF